MAGSAGESAGSGEHLAAEGAQLGRYRLLARLGTGGMAEVYLGRIEGPAGFTKPVAIKRMRVELTSNQEFVDLFLEEARTASLLAHPNICQVHELSTAAGQYFMVLEYLEGVPLSSVLARILREPRLFNLSFITGVIEQAAEGLHYAHEITDEEGRPLRVVHRDVSPPNLFVTVGGVVKVLDFGISKSRHSLVRTLTGQIRGKFSYMSPEQLRGESLDRRTDIFSLGIVLFELVAARRLFRRRSRLGIFQAIVKDPIPSIAELCPDLDRGLCAVIDRALARDRDDRFASARELGEALVEASQAHGGPANTADIGRTVQARFAEELEDARQMLASGPHVDGEGPETAASTTSTANLRGQTGRTANETARGWRDFVDTNATTHALAFHDATLVDLVVPPPPDFDDA